MNMNMSMDTQVEQGCYIRVPNVPMDALRVYIRVLCQMHTIMDLVGPDHAWFNHHMGRLQRAAVVLKEKCSRRTVDRRATRHLAQVEANRWLDDTNADWSVRVSVLESLKQGLPQVDDARPV